MGRTDTIRAYAELMRVANVLTAVSNVWMGMIVTTGGLPGWEAVGLTAASSLLYLGGMVLNDVFDHQVDAVERPERPIPSGRVPLESARRLGWALLAGGVTCGWAVARLAPTMAPGVIATLLAALILAYDAGGVKKTLGPLLMCLCRVTNVALGASLVAKALVGGSMATILLGIGLYIASVTLFARHEAETSRRGPLVWSASWTLVALAVIAATPWVIQSPLLELRIQPVGWIALWIVVAGTILRRMVAAILQPSAKNVQRAVGNAVLSLIVIDASICLGYAEPYWACAVLALIAPAMLLAQWFKVS